MITSISHDTTSHISEAISKDKIRFDMSLNGLELLFPSSHLDHSIISTETKNLINLEKMYNIWIYYGVY